MLQFPHLHLYNTHIVSTDEKLEEEKMPDKKKESIYIEAFARKKQNKQLQTSTLPSNRFFKSSLSLVFCQHLHAFGRSMSILCRPVGRQHKQQLRHHSKLVMNSAGIRATCPVRLLSRIHGRIKLISEASESKLISKSDEVEDIVKFFRILLTMEPKRNYFRC